MPFLRIDLPLCAGIISGLYYIPDLLFISGMSLLIAAGLILSTFFNKSLSNIIFGLTFTITLFLVGLLMYSYEKTRITSLEARESIYAGTMTGYPVEKGNSYMLTLKLHGKISRNEDYATGGTLLIYVRKDSSPLSYLPGDILIVECKPDLITNRGNPEEFDYRFFMETQGIKYVSYISNQKILKRHIPNHRKLRYKALILREKIISMYRERGITGDKLALVAAIIVGQKDLLDPDQKQIFIKAGVMHIMAVSGLHAGILSIFIFNLLFFLKGRLNYIRIVLTILLLWSFAFVTGLTPSVLRATLMFSFLHAGNLINRKVNGINSILASAFVLIILKPSVLFEAGFLLSYSAVIFIVAFYKLVYDKLKFKNWLLNMIWQSAAVTLVAQAGTLALTIMLFNRFPVYFLLSNIVIVPLSSLLIIIGALVPLTFPAVFVSKILADLLNYLTGITELLTKIAASLPLSTIGNIGMTPLHCLMLSIIIFASGYYFFNRKSVSINLLITLILGSIIFGTIQQISIRSTNQLIVYNAQISCTIGIKTGKILNIYSDTSVIDHAVIRHSATLGLKIKMHKLDDNPCYITSGEKKILITNGVSPVIPDGFKTDFLIMRCSPQDFPSDLYSNEFPLKVIFTSGKSLNLKYSGIPESAVAEKFHFIKKSGAFIAAL